MRKKTHGAVCKLYNRLFHHHKRLLESHTADPQNVVAGGSWQEFADRCLTHDVDLYGNH